MTKQIGNHGLFCLDSEDYAAIALSMQCNAEAIDATLTEQSEALTDFSDRPFVSFTNSTPFVINNDSSSGTIGPENLVGSSFGVGFGNGGFNRIINTLGGWPTGFYLMGASINWTVATPTNNTRRLLMVYGIDTIDGFTSATATYTDLYVATDYEGSTGGTGALTVVGMLHNDGNLATIQSHFTHRNTGSTINVAVNQWRIWAMYLGAGVVV